MILIWKRPYTISSTDCQNLIPADENDYCYCYCYCFAMNISVYEAPPLKSIKQPNLFPDLYSFVCVMPYTEKAFLQAQPIFLISSLFCFPSHPFFPAISSGKWLWATCSLRVIHALPKAINCMYLHLDNVTRVSKQLNGHKMIVRCILWIVAGRDAERINKWKHRNLRYKN